MPGVDDILILVFVSILAGGVAVLAWGAMLLIFGLMGPPWTSPYAELPKWWNEDNQRMFKDVLAECQRMETSRIDPGDSVLLVNRERHGTYIWAINKFGAHPTDKKSELLLAGIPVVLTDTVQDWKLLSRASIVDLGE